MKSRTLFKLITGFLVVTTASLARDLHSNFYFENPMPCGETDLPKGCEDYDLIQGNLQNSNSFFLLETHKKCDSARVSCTTALLNQKFKNNSTMIKEKATVLFEFAEMNQTVLCKEQGLDHLVDDCQGWNRAENERSDVKLRSLAISDFIFVAKTLLNEFLKLPLKQQKTEAIEGLEGIISAAKKSLEAKKSFVSFKEANKLNFFTVYSNDIKYEEIQLKYFTTLLTKVKKTNVLSIEILKSFENINEKMDKEVQRFANNAEESLGKPNKSLLKSIKNTASKNKTGVAFVGRAHMSKNYNTKVGRGKAHLDAVDELYRDLNEFADENPYAVLECKM